MKKMIKNFVIILTVAGCLFYLACKGDNQVYAQDGWEFSDFAGRLSENAG